MQRVLTSVVGLFIAALLALAVVISPTRGGGFANGAPLAQALPDLVVVSLEAGITYSGCTRLGMPEHLKVTIRNNGTAAAGSFVVELNGNSANRVTVSSLAAGQTSSVIFGSGYTLNAQNTARIDATSLVAESNESNNQLTAFVPPPPPMPTCTATPTRTATLTPTPTSPGGPLPDLIVGFVTITSQSMCPYRLDTRIEVRNIGSSSAGSFVVQATYQNKAPQTQTVAGLAAGQSTILWFPGFGYSSTGGGWNSDPLVVVVDSTGLVAENSEANNQWSGTLHIPDVAPPTCTPTRTATRSPTGPTATRTRTGSTGPTATRTATRTATSAATRTPTSAGGACSPVNATIAAPFTKDGAGTFCWQASNLGSAINSWNLTKLTVNGVDFTNTYAATSTLPAKINGYWYVSYSSSASWGHFEAN
jgi:subtilase family serine protease